MPEAEDASGRRRAGDLAPALPQLLQRMPLEAVDHLAERLREVGTVGQSPAAAVLAELAAPSWVKPKTSSCLTPSSTLPRSRTSASYCCVRWVTGDQDHRHARPYDHPDHNPAFSR
jgi:hypothetical protein